MDAFLLGHGLYSCVQWILYMPFVHKSSTHSYPRPHTLPTPTPTHTPHTPTSHPVTFTHNSLTHSPRPPPHTHTHRITTTTPLALCTKWLPWKRVFFFFLLLLLLQKLTQSMHLDNKLDWVNQHSFQGIHFVFLLGLSLFILNIKYCHVCDQKKWKISLLNGYSSWYKHAINKFLIDNSASCSSQDIQVFEN